MSNTPVTKEITGELTAHIGCGCGHDHGHEHTHNELTAHIGCSCGHDHGHTHEHTHNELTANIGCSCGRDHGHTHEHTHNELTANIGCSCGHDHGHEHTHNELTANIGCSCGHDHSHGELTAGVGCDCGHDHGADAGHEHTHDHGPFGTRERLIFAGAVLLAAVGLAAPLGNIVKFAVLAGATLMAGYPMFIAGIKGLRHLSMDETALLTVAVVAAFAIGELPEAFLVTALFRLGNLMENAAVERSKRDIEALTQIRPESANLLLPDGSHREVPARGVAVGSQIIIKPGEKVPLDAVVLTGTSNIDTAALTGESMARHAEPGATLLSGSINLDGMLVCKTVNSFEGSAASRIIEMVKESSAKKSKTENFITRFSRVYTPCIIVAAVALATVPPLLGFGELTDWVSRSLVFLVASCPCALAISIPLSFFAGVGAASKVGVLVKGSKYLEVLAKADTFVFDKTGTLTTGKLHVVGISPAEGYTEQQVLRLAAAAESYSNHPLAQAIVSHAPEVELGGVGEYSEISGRGVLLKLSGEEILCGSARLMSDYNVDICALAPGNVYVAKGRRAVGSLALQDTPRAEAAEVVAELRKLGIKRNILLSGDGAQAVEAVAQAVGLDEAHAGLLPEGKVELMEQIKKAAGVTVYVGDGINDAPVLALSDVGVAMGLGTDAAIETADVVLVSESLRSLPKAIGIARRIVAISTFNIVFALGIKAVVLLLGALGMAQMWMAVFADVGVSVIAVLNSTRILAVKK